MNQETQDSKDVLLELLVNKVEKQERQSQVQQEEIDRLKEQSGTVGEFREALNSAMDKIQQTGDSIRKVSRILQNPPKTETVHHHHFPKVLWVSAGLWLALSFAICQWYMTHEKLGQYEANDIKYRKLVLDGPSESLRVLRAVDSVYTANPDSIRNYVEEQEKYRKQYQALSQEMTEVKTKITTPAADVKTRKK